MPDLTNEEYDELDEYWTTHTPKLSGNGKGGTFAELAEREGRDHIVFVDDITAKWLRVKAAADLTTPEAVIGRLVRKEMAVAAV